MSTTQSQQRNSFFGILMGVAAIAFIAMIGAGVYFVMGPTSAPSSPIVSNTTSQTSNDSAETAAPAAAAAQATEPVQEAVAAEPEVEPEPVAAVVEPEVEPEIEAEDSAEPAPEVDLTFAVADRSVNCSLLTEALEITMETRLDMNVELVEYDSADSLFAALSDGDVDMTLCFVDPEDRSQMSGENNGRIGYMRQVGSAIWDSGYGKLQIWGFGAAKSDLRNSHPCALTLLEKFAVPDGDLNANNAEEWLTNNANNIADWSTCES